MLLEFYVMGVFNAIDITVLESSSTDVSLNVMGVQALFVCFLSQSS